MASRSSGFAARLAGLAGLAPAFGASSPASAPRAAFVLALTAIGGAALVVGTGACSGSSRDSGFDPAQDGGTSNSSGSNGNNASGGFSESDAGNTGSSDGCSDDAKLVYVLSLEGDIYSFAPAEKKFTKIGPLECASGGDDFTPISMAVDRNAVAWINMRAGSLLGGRDVLFKVDTKTGKCEESGIEGGYASMGGMGFSTNGANTQDETLFVIGEGSSPLGSAGLNKVDGNKLTLVADFEDPVGELTGTGDGRLYGFLLGQQLGLAQIDKTSTALSDNVTLSGVKLPQAPMYAFSFWGGDFYVYTADSTSMSNTTTVARYSPSTKKIEATYMTNIGFHIVGAGVSTCAPTTSPK